MKLHAVSEIKKKDFKIYSKYIYRGLHMCVYLCECMYVGGERTLNKCEGIYNIYYTYLYDYKCVGRQTDRSVVG